MSRQNFVKGYRLANDEDLSASFETSPVTVRTACRVGFNIATSGVTSGTGTFQVQHRIYRYANNYSAWATLTLDSTPTMAGADAEFLVDVSVPPGQVRVKYTAAGSPDGTCDVWVTTGEEG